MLWVAACHFPSGAVPVRVSMELSAVNGLRQTCCEVMASSRTSDQRSAPACCNPEVLNSTHPYILNVA